MSEELPPEILKAMNKSYCKRERYWRRIPGATRGSGQSAMTDAEKQMRKYHWHAWERWAKSKVTTLMQKFVAARKRYLLTHTSAPEEQWEYLSGENVWLPTDVDTGITNELSQFIWEHYGPTRMKKDERRWFFPPAKTAGSQGGVAAQSGEGGAGGVRSERGEGGAGGAQSRDPGILSEVPVRFQGMFIDRERYVYETMQATNGSTVSSLRLNWFQLLTDEEHEYFETNDALYAPRMRETAEMLWNELDNVQPGKKTRNETALSEIFSSLPEQIQQLFRNHFINYLWRYFGLQIQRERRQTNTLIRQYFSREAEDNQDTMPDLLDGFYFKSPSDQIYDILSALHTKLQSLELRQLDGV